MSSYPQTASFIDDELLKAIENNTVRPKLQIELDWKSKKEFVEYAEVFVNAIRKNTNITNLSLSGMDFSNQGAAILHALANHPTLKSISLSYIENFDSEVFIELCAMNVNITNMELNSIEFGSHAGTVFQALGNHPTLQSLNLLFLKNFDPQTLIPFAEAMENNQTLKKLSFQGNNLGNVGAAIIAAILSVNNSLEELSFYDNRLGSQGVSTIATALQTNTGLKSFSLKEWYLGSAAGCAIAEALKVNNTLRSLTLYQNHFAEDVGLAFAEVLKVNKALTSLEVSQNGLGPTGVSAIAEALKVNETLQKLDLSITHPGNEAGKMMANALKVNKTLKSLDFHQNDIRNSGCQAFVSALQNNFSMTSINLGDNGGDDGDDNDEENTETSESIYNQITELACSLTKRNEVIHEIRKQVETLSFSNVPLSLKFIKQNVVVEYDESRYESVLEEYDSEKKWAKEEGTEINIYSFVPSEELLAFKAFKVLKKGASDEFDVALYEKIVENCKYLEENDCDPKIVQELRDEAMVALSSWDSYKDNSFRFRELTNIVNRYQTTAPLFSDFKSSALSVLSRIYFTEAMENIQNKQEKEADENLALAYTTGIHGLSDEMTKDTVFNALSALAGKISIKSVDPKVVLQDLYTNHVNKFMKLKEIYFAQCKLLGIAPNTFLLDIKAGNEQAKELATPIIYSSMMLSSSTTLPKEVSSSTEERKSTSELETKKKAENTSETRTSQAFSLDENDEFFDKNSASNQEISLENSSFANNDETAESTPNRNQEDTSRQSLNSKY